jgi:predicted RNA-binding Zn-ribbon protein involved in translation (DUF1610 family)
MASHGNRSPFERLKSYYQRAEPVCPACGYEDEEGGWTAETDGSGVVYRHTCPSCGAEREYSVQFTDRETAHERVERR